jgi:hypothetical protein
MLNSEYFSKYNIEYANNEYDIDTSINWVLKWSIGAILNSRARNMWN